LGAMIFIWARRAASRAARLLYYWKVTLKCHAGFHSDQNGVT